MKSRRQIADLILLLLAGVPLAILAKAAYDWPHAFVTPANLTANMVLPILLVLSMAFARFRWPELRWVIVVNVSALFAALLAADAYVAMVAGKQGAHLSDQRHAPANTNPAAKLLRIDELRRNGIAAYATFHPTTFVTAPQGGEALRLMLGDQAVVPAGSIARTTSVYCNEHGAWFDYETDEFGFFGPAGVWSAPQVALVGDSFTMGACVAQNEGIAGRLRGDFPRLVNLGSGGNGPLAELMGLREYLQPLHPPVVVWFYYSGNDLADLAREGLSPLLTRYLDPSFRIGLPQHQAEIDAQLIALAREQEELVRSQAGVSPQDTLRPDSGVPPRLSDVLVLRHIRPPMVNLFTAEKQFLETINIARTEIESWGGTFILVFLPNYDEVMQSGGLDVGERFLRANVIDKGFNVIDALPLLRAEKDRSALFAYPGSHYNPRGYEIVAESVRAAIAAALERGKSH